MKAARVNTKQRLEALVSRLNEHQRRVQLVEAEAAPAAAPGVAPTASAPAPSGAPVGKPAAPSPDAGAGEEQAEASVAEIIDQLNAIRGGRSFKEPQVEQELARYFDGLEPSEQDALHAYLKGLAQIVSGQVEAGSAEEPKDHGVEAVATGKKSRTIKPNVVKKAAAPHAPVGTPAASPTAPPVEDTRSPAPIVPKKR